MMTCEKLEIELFRVSPDSKFLDIMLECPEAYYMSGFELKVVHWVRLNNKDVVLEDSYNFSDNLKLDEDKPDKWRIRVSLTALGINYPAMYYATFTAKHLRKEIHRKIVDEAVASDVNYVYLCILKDIVESCDPCKKNAVLPDSTIMNYLILYGHQAAMFLRDFYTAENYFKILSKCFNNCNCAANTCGCQLSEPCGCNGECKDIITIVKPSSQEAHTVIIPDIHSTATADQISNLNLD